MKKTVLFSIGVLSVLFVSCRQNDNILSNEDVTTLKIIQKNRNSVCKIRIWRTLAVKFCLKIIKERHPNLFHK